MTLEEALAKGRVKVRETGNVNELTVENVGDSEVFVQAGDIVKGGRQDRVLSVDLLLPPRSGVVPIAAFCVEAGRWTARGQEDGRQFSTAAAAMPSHEAKLAMRTYMANASAPSPACRQPYAADPVARRHRIEPAENLGDGQANARSPGAVGRGARGRAGLAVELATLARKRKAQGGAGGVPDGACKTARSTTMSSVTLPRSTARSAAATSYASPELFRKMWPKLLSANVTEAIGTRMPQAGPAVGRQARGLHEGRGKRSRSPNKR